VTARVDDELVTVAEDIMQRHGRVDVSERERLYRQSGWSGFDEASTPFTPADVARDRALYTTRPKI
jgi:hypothetical protein